MDFSRQNFSHQPYQLCCGELRNPHVALRQEILPSAQLFHLLPALARSAPCSPAPGPDPSPGSCSQNPRTASWHIPPRSLLHQFPDSSNSSCQGGEELSSPEGTSFQYRCPLGPKELTTSRFRKLSCSSYQKYLPGTAQNSVFVHQMNRDYTDPCCFHTLKIRTLRLGL